ncbi:MAG TPA: cyclodeaminase/cyclohydrolase family protein, partial [Anaerolineae bacterium]
MSEPMTNQPVNGFLAELASAAPAPGGGAVAALAGALGAALVSMVANLTVGKKDYAGVQDQVQNLLSQAEALRGKLAAAIEDDYTVFMQLSAAMKLPRATDEEKAARTAAVQAALKAATDVPMQIAEGCAAVMKLCRPVAEIGNANAVSDAGVAVLLAEAGLRSAALNVMINLVRIKDEAFVAEKRGR